MKDQQYRLGLVSVSFRQHSPKEILEAAKASALSCIEWGSDVHAPCDDLKRITEIATMQKEYGISCSSYGTYFRLGETSMEELKNYITAAKILETNILRLWCGVKSGSNMTSEEKNALLLACRKAADIAESNGVTLCMECHKKTFTEAPDDAVWLMESVASPHFRMYWQPFQWQNIEQNIENAKRIAPYAEHIHVFNWKEKEKLPLENAIMEWQSYLNVFPTPRTLLLEFMPNGSINELQKEATALKSIIGETI